MSALDSACSLARAEHSKAASVCICICISCMRMQLCLQASSSGFLVCNTRRLYGCRKSACFCCQFSPATNLFYAMTGARPPNASNAIAMVPRPPGPPQHAHIGGPLPAPPFHQLSAHSAPVQQSIQQAPAFMGGGSYPVYLQAPLPLQLPKHGALP